jgi:hypothetical protein
MQSPGNILVEDYNDVIHKIHEREVPSVQNEINLKCFISVKVITAKITIESMIFYDRRPVGQSVLVSGIRLGPANNLY